jgi:hypothetical protein
MWPDYDLDKEETWVVMESPTVDRSWEEQLTRIGGLNPFKKPVLVWRWGATYRDPMSTDNGLKYWLCNRPRTLIGFEFTDPVTEMTLSVKKLEDVPNHILVAVPKYNGDGDYVQLGQRRIIIEQWRSPEFLARSRRYTASMQRDPGSVQEFFFCKNCGDEPLLVGNDGPNPCAKCGSTRSYIREVREEGDGKLLRSFPSEGCYDCFLILENSEGGPMAPDANALGWIEKLWSEQKEKSLKEQMSDSYAETAGQYDLNRAATSPANPFKQPAVSGW